MTSQGWQGKVSEAAKETPKGSIIYNFTVFQVRMSVLQVRKLSCKGTVVDLDSQ